MTLLIWGAGAIGGTIGAYLARAGVDVVLVDTDAAHVEAIQTGGLHIEGPIETFTVRVRAATPDQVEVQFDRILCDVPCSGDGTMRKAPDIWRRWTAANGNGLHALQINITLRACQLLKVWGVWVVNISGHALLHILF